VLSDPASPSMTQEEYLLLNEFITEHFGIHFPEEKLEILAGRLRSRLQILHLRRYMDYYLHLHYDPDGELGQLARAVTNNETYFFRETLQFEALLGDGLDPLRKSSAFDGTLRLLCAGCSSGEEPYTLNIYCRESILGLAGTTVEIHGFDIDTERLDMARGALYRPYSLRCTTQQQVRRYFQADSDQRYRLKPLYQEGVRVFFANILDLDSYRPPLPYDVVFCRNVLMYFSEAALRKAIDHFAQVVRPGGFLFLGHAESIIGMSPEFETVRLGSCIAYQRPVAP
jgi:chemotaxis protein methyltransferase CheR